MDDLRQRRKDAGLSGAELARQCGCSRAYICMLESGRSKPSESMKQIINKALAGKSTRKDVQAKKKLEEEEKQARAHDLAFKNKAEKAEFHEYWCIRYGSGIKRREEIKAGRRLA